MRTLLVLSFFGGWGVLQAQDSVYSPPMGFVKISLLGRTDNLVTIPILQEPVAIGNVTNVTSNTVSLSNAAWTVNQYAPTTTQSYYVEISTGQLQGLYYEIVSNTATTLTLNTGTDNLTEHPLGAVAVGDTIRVRPYWTVGQVFGTTDATVPLTPVTTLPTALQADSGDSLLFYNPADIGIEKVPPIRLIYVKSTGWRLLSDATTDQEGFLLAPLSPVLVRLRQSTEQDLVLLGDAFQAPATINVPVGNGNLANDVFLGIASSEPVALNNLGLVNTTTPSQTVINLTTQSNQRQDLLLTYDPTRKGFERPPEHTYYYLSGQGWLEVGSATPVGIVLLDPTQSYVLRRRATAQGNPYWFQNATP